MGLRVSSGSSEGGSGGAGGAGGGTEGGTEGGGIDRESFLDEVRQSFEPEINANRDELTRLRNESAETGKVLDGLRRALGGGEEDGPPADPEDAEIEHYGRKIDQYINAAIEAERQGRKIPLTADAAIENFRGHIKALERQKAQRKSLEAQDAEIKRLSNPATALDQSAFTSMDGMLANALKTVFGDAPEMQQVKAAQFDSVCRLIGAEIKNLRATQPGTWEQIRRTPADQKRLVAHFVKQVIPPKARELLEREQIANTPVTLGDLHQAWAEMKEMKPSPQKDEIRVKLRRQILEEKYMQGRFRDGAGARQGPRSSDLF